MTSPAFFLSYRRLDVPDVVGRIHDRIASHFGAKSVFRDVDSIAPGTDFRLHLQQAMEGCQALVAIIGPRFLPVTDETAPDYVVEEVASALERNLTVVPVLVHGAEMPRPERLPPRIKDLSFRQAIPVRGDPDFASDMDKLLRALTRPTAKPNKDSPPGEDALDARPSIVLVSGPRKGMRFSLEKEYVLIGRGEICDISLETAHASRCHAAILNTRDALLCEDLGTIDGTYVNGNRISQRTRLHDGDRIHIGTCILQVQLVRRIESPR